MCFLPTFLSPCLRVDHCSITTTTTMMKTTRKKWPLGGAFYPFFALTLSLSLSGCLSFFLLGYWNVACLLTHNGCITWQCRVVAEDITAFALLVQTNTTMYVDTTDRQTVMDLDSTATTLLYRGCGLWRVSVRTGGYRTDIFHVHSGWFIWILNNAQIRIFHPAHPHTNTQKPKRTCGDYAE